MDISNNPPAPTAENIDQLFIDFLNSIDDSELIPLMSTPELPADESVPRPPAPAPADESVPRPAPTRPHPFMRGNTAPPPLSILDSDSIANAMNLIRYRLINPIPINVDNILFDSLNEPPVYKKILSEKGSSQLKKIKFIESSKTNNTCPIFQVDFCNDDDIIELPCRHCFNPDAITKWLCEEQPICPICRFELDSIEVKIKEEEEEINSSENEQYLLEENVVAMDGSEFIHPTPSSLNLIRSLYNLNNIINSSVTHLSHTERGDRESMAPDEEEDLQQAIYESLRLIN